MVAVSEKNGGVYNAGGLDVEAAGKHYAATGSLAGLPDADEIDNDELLAVDCDVLVPAAMENTLDARTAPRVRARIVVEAANGRPRPRPTPSSATPALPSCPTSWPTPAASRSATFEWVQGLENFFWDKKRVEDELQRTMERAFDAVHAKADSADCDYRTAAYTIAVGRVAESCRLKGLFP